MSKKGKFYILNWIFSYGSASSNRLLAYANSAAELGYDVEIVAFLRLDLRNCQPRNGVIIRGLRPCKVESKVFSKLLSFFTTIWFLLADVKKEFEQGFQGWEYKFNTVASSRGDRKSVV